MNLHFLKIIEAEQKSTNTSALNIQQYSFIKAILNIFSVKGLQYQEPDYIPGYMKYKVQPTVF